MSTTHPVALFLGVASLTSAVNTSINCAHGHQDPEYENCICDDGWKTAGITDTLHFLQGTCSQYSCTSDEECVKLLNISEASCMLPGWNCYCGWGYAVKHGLTGYETDSAKYMGVVYTFSMWASRVIELLLVNLYRYFLALALLLVPFGRKRAICDHHRPGLWNIFRRMVGMPSTCPGDCVLPSQYSSDSFMDDLAWSIYVVELMCWAYLFCVVIYLTVLFLWSVILWLSVLLLFAAAAFFAICAGCAEGLAGCADCCAGAGGGCVADCPCGCDCFGAGFAHGFAHGPLEAEMFYFGGTFPHDPFWTLNGYGGATRGDSDCCCCCCRLRELCLPIAAMVYVFPVLPENAWGGMVGYLCLGTHQWTPVERMYTGGNRVVDFLGMGWRRNSDLHNDQDWRSRVFDFLAGDPLPVSEAYSPRISRRDDPHAHLLNEYMANGKQVVHVGLARAVLIKRPLEKGRDKCVPSSFEDYLQNTCWICREESDEWDLWVSCHHLFCSRCSSQMLIRRMPCPLCRVASTTVLRGASALPSAAFRQVNPANRQFTSSVPKQGLGSQLPPPPTDTQVVANRSRQLEAAQAPPTALPRAQQSRPVTPMDMETSVAIPKLPTPRARSKEHEAPRVQEMPKAAAVGVPKAAVISSVQPSASLASAALPTSAGTNVARRSPTQQVLPSEPKVAAVAAVAVAAPTSKELFQEAQPMEHAAGPSESSQAVVAATTVHALSGAKRLQGFKTSTAGAPYRLCKVRPALEVLAQICECPPLSGVAIPEQEAVNKVLTSTSPIRPVSLSGMYLLRKIRPGQEQPSMLASTAGIMFLRHRAKSTGCKESARSFGQADALPGLKCLEHASPSSEVVPFEAPKIPELAASHRVLSGSLRLRNRHTSCAGILFRRHLKTT